MKIKQIVRFYTWWNFILPPLLAFIYLFLLLLNTHWAEALIITGLFLIWMIGAASFGIERRRARTRAVNRAAGAGDVNSCVSAIWWRS